MERIHYFIDSENVGSDWMYVLDYADDNDELLVFYTDRSPYMSYENIIRIRESNKNLSFIKCHEGNNALDFQLSTQLGYMVHDMKEEDSYIIVSNDTGFDAIVKYWQAKSIEVERFTSETFKVVTTSPDFSEEASLDCIDMTETESVETSKVAQIMDAVPSDEPKATDKSMMDKQANEILYILGKNDLPRLHTALVAIFGDKLGKQYYNAFKSNPGYDHYISKHPVMKPKEKQELYCSIVFAMAGNSIQVPKGFSDFIVKSWNNKKNLNSLRASLQGKYGKDKYETYYKLIKTHVKILYKIK